MKDNSAKLNARKLALKHFKQFVGESMKEDSMPDLEKLMGDRKNKLMKVTVASDSKEGLKSGLSKAEEILKAKKEMDGEEMPEHKMHGMDEMKKMHGLDEEECEESPEEEESMEAPEEESSEDFVPTPEELAMLKKARQLK